MAGEADQAVVELKSARSISSALFLFFFFNDFFSNFGALPSASFSFFFDFFYLQHTCFPIFELKVFKSEFKVSNLELKISNFELKVSNLR